MIPRSVLRRFRPTAAPPSVLHQPASSHLRPYLLSQRIPAPARARIAARWYSDDTKPAGNNGASDESLGASDPKGGEPTVADSSKKELEAKNKEVAEFKVRSQHRHLAQDTTRLDEAVLGIIVR